MPAVDQVQSHGGGGGAEEEEKKGKKKKKTGRVSIDNAADMHERGPVSTSGIHLQATNASCKLPDLHVRAGTRLTRKSRKSDGIYGYTNTLQPTGGPGMDKCMKRIHTYSLYPHDR